MTRRADPSPIDRFCTWLIRAQSRWPRAGQLAVLALRFFSVTVPPTVKIGRDVVFPHITTGLVMHPRVTIGDRVTILHNVTLGRGDVHELTDDFGGIVIEDDVVIGAGAVVLASGSEPLIVGRGAVIGANAVLTHSVGPGEKWAGNPARRLNPGAPKSTAGTDGEKAESSSTTGSELSHRS